MQKLTIPFRLPSLNEYIDACRRNPHAGAALKERTDKAIMWEIRLAKMTPVENPCIVQMVFTGPNYRRDVDNVESAKKRVAAFMKGFGIPRVGGCDG